MSKLALKGNASGTGTFTLEAPNSNTDRTLTLPDEAGTVLTSGGAIDVDASAPADSLAIDSSGNVGIGTSSPSVEFEVNGDVAIAGAGNTLFLPRASDGAQICKIFSAISNDLTLSASGSGSGFIRFEPSSGSGEAARINSSGDLLIGATSTVSGSTGGAEFKGDTDGRRILRLATTTTADRSMLGFINPNGSVGSISISGSSTSYNTSSDYRLKEDWVPMSDSIARVKALNPVNFAWKVDGTRVDGFLAHEAQEVVPEAVTGEKDAMTTEDVLDEEGNVVGTKEVPEYQGIDQAKLVPLLTAALQEAIGRIEALEAEVAELKGASA